MINEVHVVNKTKLPLSIIATHEKGSPTLYLVVWESGEEPYNFINHIGESNTGTFVIDQPKDRND